MGLTPGNAISYGTSPWRIVMYCIWVLAVLGLAWGVYRTVQIAQGKVEVKEKVRKARVDDDDDEY